jgi:putative oxidoreductase
LTSFATTALGWTTLVRLLVGLIVFLPEGIQKLIYPVILGAGRFARVGIPYPDVRRPFVSIVETLCGGLVVIGLPNRLASVLLIVIAIVAILESPDLIGP